MIYTFDSTQSGAPVLSGTAGALAALLKACLVDGFGAGAVSSLVVTGGVAKLTYAGVHPLKVGSVARIAGATPSGLNGDKVITAVTTNSASFAASGIADGAATGTVTSRAAPAGWQVLFPGSLTDVLVLKPSVVEATGCMLRVDDTGTTQGRVVGYESMADASTGTGAFPTAAQVSGGMYWPKSTGSDSSARAWTLIADERAMMLLLSPQPSYQSQGVLVSFGDFVSAKSVDGYACMLTGCDSSGISSSSWIRGCLGFGSGSGQPALAYVARSASGLGGAQLVVKTAAYNTAEGYSGSVTGYTGFQVPYPNAADNSLRISVVELMLGSEGFRGVVPGVYHSVQRIGTSLGTGDVIAGTGVNTGRVFRALSVGPTASSSGVGVVFVDTTGPWR